MFPDRRAMEGFMAGLFGRVEADTNGAVDDAQEMMWFMSLIKFLPPKKKKK